MTTEGFKRKLAAIFSADVEGYSRLMGDDEEATIQTLTAYRELMTLLIQQYRGRVVDSPGDNLLAEFPSVVDAVQCAVEVQKVLQAKNEELPESRRMRFRIGVNLGDVIQEGARIYGDGVNIAARIESLADGGGICISGNAHEQIENKLALGYEFCGEYEVKNIAKPIKVYRVPLVPGTETSRTSPGRAQTLGKWPKVIWLLAAALIIIVCGSLIWNLLLRLEQSSSKVHPEQKQAFRPSDKPSIAVLPFINLSGDPQQEYFSDGITENVITSLSKLPKLFVISRNSTFIYKGKPVKIQQLGEKLGVHYVLEGSVQRARDKVRITAQLIDATTEQHLWAERYDRDLKDIFALQDEITMEIIKALQIELTGSERVRVVAKGTNNLEAYLKLLQGQEAFRHRSSPGHLERARAIAREVIALDPDYPKGYALLAQTLIREVGHGRSEFPSTSIEQASQLAQKVLDMDESDIDAHIVLGNIYLQRNQNEMAIAELEKAVSLNPNSTEAIGALGRVLLLSDKPQRALELFRRAIRLDPIHAQRAYLNLGQTHRYLGQYEEAVPLFKKIAQDEPDIFNLTLELIVCYTAVGKKKEADAQVAKLLDMEPGFSLRELSMRIPIRNAEPKKTYLDLLRKAGLPD